MLNPTALFVFAALGMSAVGEEVSEIRFNRDIRPILSDKCFFCHGTDPETREGDLRLDLREPAVKAGALVPGDPKKSMLVERIYSNDADDLMPPAKSHKELDADEKKLLARWIAAGAEYEDHWAYTQLKQPDFGALDEMVAMTLRDHGLKFSPEADRRTLIRRVTLDLTGLPPTPDEVRKFSADTMPDAYERLVERLLASPHYGERMAVPWLDAVRYADTVGYHGDNVRDASPFRDYVIRSFNEDKPFDQFTTEQLAGDLLPDATLQQRIAASYNRLNQLSKEGGIQDAEYIKKYQAERVRTTATAWLGSTMACAECHDHKFDPFTTRDFYSFAAFFADILEKGAWNNDGHYQEDIKKWKEQGVKFTDFGPVLEVPGVAPEPSRFVPATISAKPREMRIRPRGNWTDNSGEIVLPSTPAFLPNAMASTEEKRLSRLDLAQWIVDPENPLTARTAVNRMWAQFFGTALSRNTGDLGSQGAWPSHPEVLDWLAAEFVANGWSTKHVVRTIVLSRTYRQSSAATAELLAKDPGNSLLARQSRRRLDAEFIRDNALAVGGLLDRGIGGRSAKPYQPTGHYQHLNFPRRKYQADTGRHQYRRGLYTHWQRTFTHPMMKNFDAPSREECAVDRMQSNTPLQALNLLNDPSFTEAARALAELVVGSENAIAVAFERVLARPPSTEEVDLLRGLHERELKRFGEDPKAAGEFLRIGQRSVPANLDPVRLAAMTSVTRAMLNLHETVTRF